MNKWIVSIFPAACCRVKRANVMKYIPYIRFPAAGCREYQLICSVSLILSLLLVTGAWPSGSPTDAKTDKTLKGATDAVLSYFNPSNGTVAAVAGGTVSIGFAAEGDIKKGMRFSVFRTGKPFYHPITNELIGETEDLVGRVEVNE
ncbi:MAG: hypothetical protein C4560_08920, partial [Nitrospiraceae bacterium]